MTDEKKKAGLEMAQWVQYSMEKLLNSSLSQACWYTLIILAFRNVLKKETKLNTNPTLKHKDLLAFSLSNDHSDKI